MYLQVVQMSKSTTTRAECQNSENKNPNPSSSENPRKLVVNGLNNLNRATEFKDISNSPLSKRKFDPEDMEEDVTPKRKKLIIPLEPDLNDNDELFETGPFDLKIAAVSEVKREDIKGQSAKLCSKDKVRHKNAKNASHEGSKGKDNLQSAITKWALKQTPVTEINSDNNNVPSKHKSLESKQSHEHVKPSSHKSKKDKHNTIDSYFEKSSEKKPKLRSREKLRQVRYPEYDYTEVSPKKRKTEAKWTNNGSVSKLSFNSEGSDSDSSESVSENGKDFRNLDSEKDRSNKNHQYMFEMDVDDSFYQLSNRRKAVAVNSDIKKRFKSGSDICKASSSRNKSLNMHVNSNRKRTVDDFFKVNGNPVKNRNTDKTLGEIDGLICDSMGDVVSQEEKDRLFALELQKQFDFEHKYHLNSVRLKGSEESYSFRNQKKSV